MWPDRRLIDLFHIELPIVAAPMANFAGLDLALAVAEAGGLGSLPCATLDPDQIGAEVAAFRSRTRKPVNLNFFCHAEAAPDPDKDRAWLRRLSPYYAEFDAEPPALPLKAAHPPFGEAACAAVEAIRPEIVSFHFGLPAPDLLARVKAAGCKIMSSATTLREAQILAASRRRCDHRARGRGRRPSRHVSRDGGCDAGGNLRSGQGDRSLGARCR